MSTNKIGNSHAIVKIAGNLDGQKSDELMIAIEKQIIPGNVDILVDFEKVEYISSMGIGTLISLYSDIKEKNGRMVLYGIRDVVKEVFNRTYLNKRLTICDTQKDALDLLRNKHN
jgi:anti-sigma B factor antagonist